jgi:predicted nucleic acid-binding protein
MVIKVVDASALSAILFAEADGDAMAARLEDANLVAPALLEYELANVCLVKGRRASQKRRELADAFTMRGQFGVRALSVDYDEVLSLAVSTGLTVYDASYLWLARDLGSELVTLDRQLERAASGG